MAASGREIINVQVGQAGNQVGEAFWEMLLMEHGLDMAGAFTSTDTDGIKLARAGVYFSEIASSSDGAPRFVPRSIQVDLEAGVVNNLKGGRIGGLFRPDTFITGEPGAGNNWAKGFYTEGAELIDGLLDVTRKQAEACDSLQGFQMLHSLGGGTGAGLGSLILTKLREEYPDRMLATFSIMPSTAVSETVVEPYNALLSLHQLLDTTDLTVCLDNEALSHIASDTLKIKSHSFRDLNNVISRVMCGVSTSLRFPGQLNGDLRKLAMNLVPFPRLHFLVPSQAPLSPLSQSANRITVQEMTASLFDRRNMLVACDPKFGRYLTAYAMYRGDIATREVEVALRDLQTKHAANFVEWIPDNVSMSTVTVPPVGLKRAATALSNTTSIQELFVRNLETFSAMYKRKAFIHWYTNEGMDPMEFTEAESNTRDLIAEYQQYQEATVEDEYEDDVEAEEEEFEEE